MRFKDLLRGRRTELVSEIIAPPMRYAGCSPYATLIGQHGEAMRVVVFADLTEAVADFAEFCLPPVAGRDAGIVDNNNAIILSYVADHEGVSWLGTDEGFDHLTHHADFADVIAWRTQSAAKMSPEPL